MKDKAHHPLPTNLVGRSCCSAQTSPVPAPAAQQRRLTGLWALLAGLVLLSSITACRAPKPAPARPWSQDLLPSQAQVAEVRGFGGRAKQPGGSWRKLLLGDWLPMGSSVQTSSESSVTLRLYEAGIVVHVKPGSEVRLEKLAYRQDASVVITTTRLDLPTGEVAVDSANLTPGSQFEIRTPQGVTRIPPRVEK